MNNLAGKVAVVTGASKGIGAAIAKALADEGAAVVVNYAGSKDGADAVVAAITGAGGKAIAVQASVAKSADVERLFAETKKAYGRLDVLVNNAGVYAMQALADIDEDHFHKHFDTNVLGVLLASKAAAKLIGDEGGSIINISSVVSTIAPAQSAVYTGTKGAVDAITAVLAKELAPRKIRVNAINPGLIETEGTRTASFIGGPMEAETVKNTPLGRAGQTGDIAPIAVFLASDASGWMTGETLVAAGGIH